MITCFFGLPGCGKSTMLAKIAAKELKRMQKGKSPYVRILSNYHIDGCDRLDFDMIGKVDMSRSLILIDEISLDADSRDYKSFGKELKQFFILHRHYGVDIYYATQQYDGVDRKIRELTHNLYYMKKAGKLTYATTIYRKITISEESDIKIGYEFPSKLEILLRPRRNMKLCWRPNYYKYFDSFEAPELPSFNFRHWFAQKSEYHFRVQLHLGLKYLNETLLIRSDIRYFLKNGKFKRRKRAERA